MDITYYAEEGMTWEEFINSSYNTTTNNCFVPGNTPSEVACFISESRYCWPSGAKLSNQIVGRYTYESNGCEKT